MGIRTSLPGTPVTLVEGGSFCVSHPSGDIADQAPCVNGGLYIAERRLLSRLVLTVNGHPLDPVDHHRDDPAAATYVGRVPGPPPGDGPVVPGPVVIRRRTLAAGMRDDIEVRNRGDEPSYVEIEIDLGADLAPLAAVRDGGTLPGPVAHGGAGPHEVLFVRGRGPGRVGCRVTATDGVAARSGPGTSSAPATMGATTSVNEHDPRAGTIASQHSVAPSATTPSDPVTRHPTRPGPRPRTNSTSWGPAPPGSTGSGSVPPSRTDPTGARSAARSISTST